MRARRATGLWVCLVVGLLLCMVLSRIFVGLQGAPVAHPSALGQPPSVWAARLMSLNEPVFFAKVTNVAVQAHDVQPGLSLSFAQLDYDVLTAWLDLSLALDPAGQYPLLVAARIYTQDAAGAARQRQMVNWVSARFLDDPKRRWPWMAHVCYVAKNQLNDVALALSCAHRLRVHTQHLSSVPAWARQLEIFLNFKAQQTDVALWLLQNLLASGQIVDAQERRFLQYTLEQWQGGAR